MNSVEVKNHWHLVHTLIGFIVVEGYQQLNPEVINSYFHKFNIKDENKEIAVKEVIRHFDNCPFVTKVLQEYL